MCVCVYVKKKKKLQDDSRCFLAHIQIYQSREPSEARSASEDTSGPSPTLKGKDPTREEPSVDGVVNVVFCSVLCSNVVEGVELAKDKTM